MEQKNIRKFQMSPDGKYIVIHGRYGHIHLVTSKVSNIVSYYYYNFKYINFLISRNMEQLLSNNQASECNIRLSVF